MEDQQGQIVEFPAHTGDKPGDLALEVVPHA